MSRCQPACDGLFFFEISIFSISPFWRFGDLEKSLVVFFGIVPSFERRVGGERQVYGGKYWAGHIVIFFVQYAAGGFAAIFLPCGCKCGVLCRQCGCATLHLQQEKAMGKWRKWRI
jgi:hypothetical protein